MIQEAFISGELGRAIYSEGGRYFVLDLESPSQSVECRPMDVSSLFCFGADVAVLSDRRLDLPAIIRELDTRHQTRKALRFVIAGMDNSLDEDIRSSSIERANELMKAESTFRFVRGRMLSRAGSANADLQTACELAIRAGAAAVATLYQNLIDYSSAISTVLDTWAAVVPDYFDSDEKKVEAESELADLEAFADAAVAVATENRSALNSLVITYGRMAQLRGIVGPLLLNDFKGRLIERLAAQSSPPKAKKQVTDDPEDQIDDRDAVHKAIANFTDRRTSSRSRKFKADEAKERVDHQIEAISKLISEGSIGRANRYLTDLINFHAEHSERKHLAMSLCLLAKVAIDARSFDMAQTLVDYALRLEIDDVVIFSTQAEVLKLMGELEEARDVYEATMERFPNNEVVRGGYAEVLRAMGEYEQARDLYKTTLERFPNDEVARGGYAEVLKAMGEFEQARDVYKAAMERFPNNEVARNGYAEVLKAMGEYEQARDIYKMTLERFPNNEVARGGYAEVLKAMGEFAQARDVYEAAMERFPKNEVVCSGYAEVLKSMGEFELARDVYQTTMDRFPNDEVTRNGYAEVLKSMGEFELARDVYKATMDRFPNNEVARNGYAEVLKSMGEFELARDVYKATMDRFPNDRIVRNGYASILVVMNRLEEARTLLPQTPPRSPDDWIAYHILAMSYLKEGNTDEAIRRLSFGLNNTLPSDRKYFATALAVAKLRRNEFAEVPKILAADFVNVDFAERQTRLVLVGHSQAALGQKDEAVKTLAELAGARNPRVINLKDFILRRYQLQPQFPRLSSSETRRLDTRIYEQEFLLAA